MNRFVILVIVFEVFFLHSCSTQRILVLSLGSKRKVVIEHVTISTFEKPYHRTEILYDDRLISYQGSAYGIENEDPYGWKSVPVRPGALDGVPVLSFDANSKELNWKVYVSPKKFSQKEFEEIGKLLLEKYKKDGEIASIASLIYFHYPDLFEVYFYPNSKKRFIEILPNGEVYHNERTYDYGSTSYPHSIYGSTTFIGKSDGTTIKMQSNANLTVSEQDLLKFKNSHNQTIPGRHKIIYR